MGATGTPNDSERWSHRLTKGGACKVYELGVLQELSQKGRNNV